MPDTRLATLVHASLVADALALPAHWIYDQAKIATEFGRVTEIMAPPPGAPYHAHEPAGGQTHYGHQALELMRAIAEAGHFDPAVFARHWRTLWGDTPIYHDGATRKTLERLAGGVPALEAGSPSTDLAGASRIAPLVAATAGLPEEAAIEAAWTQTAMTHRDTAVCEAAAFLVRAARAALAGAAVPEAIARAAEAEYVALPVATDLAKAREAARVGTLAAIAEIGLACPVAQAFPATLALALAHPGDVEGALIANVMAGGDSAARGLALGLLLGAAPGALVPGRWLERWKARAEVDAWLARASAGGLHAGT